MRKLFLLGLDGLSYSLIKRWMREGNLTNLRKIRDKGSFGILRSTIPAATAPALPSMYTGKNPAKHGIFGFLKKNNKLNVSTNLNDKSVWNILSENGKGICIANLRTTYPVEEVNGIMIAGGLMTPSEKKEEKKKDLVYPESLYPEIEGFHQGVGEDVEFIRSSRKIMLKRREKSLKKYWNAQKRKFKLFYKIYNKEDFDFSFYWMGFPDVLQHRAIDDKEILLKYFKKIDRFVSKIIKENKEANILIVSDHGFEKAPERNFYVNAWLENEGYLSIRGGKVGRRLLSKGYNLGGKLPKKHAKKALSLFKKGKKEKGQEEKSKLPDHKNLPGINLNKTVAYLHQKWGVGIIKENLGNRDYETVREELMEKLRNVEVNGEKPIKAVWKREEIFSGKYLDQVPDIIFLTSENYNAEYDLSDKLIAERNPKPAIVGYHDTAREGLLWA